MNTQELSRREVIAMLQQHKVSPTQQRIEIGQVLFSRPQHLSADQLLIQVNSKGRPVSRATIYNTLNLFARKGLVREIIVDPTRTFYDSTLTPHHHFFNVDTGELSDAHGLTLSPDQLPEPPAGTMIEDIEVIIRVRSLN